MIPPQTINVLDEHGGFTAVTRSKRYLKSGTGWINKRIETDTLWRPGSVLKGSTTGKLNDYTEQSFFQNNNDVTKAYYKVAGYGYRIAVWFDNRTGRRLA